MKNDDKKDKFEYKDDEYVLDAIGLPPVDFKGPYYNVRKLDDYCKENDLDPSELSEEEMKQFEIKPTK